MGDMADKLIIIDCCECCDKKFRIDKAVISECKKNNKWELRCTNCNEYIDMKKYEEYWEEYNWEEIEEMAKASIPKYIPPEEHEEYMKEFIPESKFKYKFNDKFRNALNKYECDYEFDGSDCQIKSITWDWASQKLKFQKFKEAKTKTEYKVICNNVYDNKEAEAKDLTGLTHKLNNLAKYGWRMVSITNTVIIFEREIDKNYIY